MNWNQYKLWALKKLRGESFFMNYDDDEFFFPFFFPVSVGIGPTVWDGHVHVSILMTWQYYTRQTLMYHHSVWPLVTDKLCPTVTVTLAFSLFPHQHQHHAFLFFNNNNNNNFCWVFYLGGTILRRLEANVHMGARLGKGKNTTRAPTRAGNYWRGGGAE